MSTDTPQLRVTSPGYWRRAAQLMRWTRRGALASLALAAAVVVYAAVFAVFGRASGAYVAGLAGPVVWPGAGVVAMAVGLGRMERAFIGYAEACSR